MPSHDHGLRVDSSDGTNWNINDHHGANTDYRMSEYTQPKGGSQGHNNLQPYISVYIFRRTA